MKSTSTSISPTGLRAAIEAHGDIFTVPVKHGPTRDITNTAGVMERAPAWSPDGQSIAYFSDESGLYALHVAPQTGDAVAGAAPVKKFPLASEPAYYFDPKWSPDSKKIAFHDNRLNIYMLDTTTGKLITVGDKNVFGGFSNSNYDLDWSPDSKWIAYPRSLANHLHALFLYSVDTGQSTQVTDEIADSHEPAFDRDGKYLYFLASTNSGATSDGLDMTSDLYDVTSNIYAVVLAADQASPIAPELDDEKTATEKKDEAKKDDEKSSDTDAKKERSCQERRREVKTGCRSQACETHQGRPRRN
jgi:tricorn protease